MQAPHNGFDQVREIYEKSAENARRDGFFQDWTQRKSFVPGQSWCRTRIVEAITATVASAATSSPPATDAIATAVTLGHIGPENPVEFPPAELFDVLTAIADFGYGLHLDGIDRLIALGAAIPPDRYADDALDEVSFCPQIVDSSTDQVAYSRLRKDRLIHRPNVRLESFPSALVAGGGHSNRQLVDDLRQRIVAEEPKQRFAGIHECLRMASLPGTTELAIGLLGVCHDSDDNVRRVAIRAVGRHINSLIASVVPGTFASQLTSAIDNLQGHNDPWTRVLAAWLAGRCARLDPAIRNVLAGPVVSRLVSNLVQLAQQTYPGDAAVQPPLLAELTPLADLEQADEANRFYEYYETRATIWALAGFGNSASSAIPSIKQLAVAADPTTRTICLHALGRIQNPSSRTVLLDASHDDTVGGAAAWALGQFGDAMNSPEVRKRLIQMIQQHTSLRVKGIAMHALGRIAWPGNKWFRRWSGAMQCLQAQIAWQISGNVKHLINNKRMFDRELIRIRNRTMRPLSATELEFRMRDLAANEIVAIATLTAGHMASDNCDCWRRYGDFSENVAAAWRRCCEHNLESIFP